MAPLLQAEALVEQLPEIKLSVEEAKAVVEPKALAKQPASVPVAQAHRTLIQCSGKYPFLLRNALFLEGEDEPAIRGGCQHSCSLEHFRRRGRSGGK